MPASESTKIQVNFKSGDALINVYAANEHELVAELTALEALAPTIAAVDAVLKGAGNLGPVAAPPSQLPQSAPAQALGAWQAQAQQAPAQSYAQYEDRAAQQGPPPGWAQGTAAPQQGYGQPPAQPYQGGQAQAGKACRHGAMLWKEGVSKTSGNPYKGWFCPGRDRNDQCKPEFAR